MRPTPTVSKKPRSGQSQGGSGAATWLNPRPARRISAVCTDPCRGGEAREGRAKNLRGPASERAYGTAGGQASKGNPKSGTGMEQARQVVGGARRREGAKPWGRNVTGGLGTAGGKWLLATGKTL